jgi:MerR family redox-sensitive transcriptional activator SoxR
MTIGELSRDTGIPASTIRYYEQAGVLPKPARISGRRTYGPDSRDRLGVVVLAQNCGFRLAEIRDLLHGFAHGTPPSRRWQKFAENKRAELETRIRKLRAMHRLLHSVLACRCESIAECGRRAGKSFPSSAASKGR